LVLYAPMRRVLAYVLARPCSAIGIGFGVFWALRFAIYGLCPLSDGFGDGFFAGVMTMVILFWAAERVQKSRHH
jgi:hypothetical protein